MSRLSVLALLTFAVFTQTALAAEIQIKDGKTQPESITVGPDGSVYTGSETGTYIYRIKKGATSADVFYDGSAEPAKTMFLGQLVDPATNTLWACEVSPLAGDTSTPAQHRSVLRAFDLTTGKDKLRWAFPNENSVCNDFAVGPDKALYITDMSASKIYRLAPGAQVPDLFLSNRLLLGVDGIAFLGNTLYVNNIQFNKFFRIPVDASGKAGAPVDIWIDAPYNGMDGMREAGGKLYATEGRSGRLVALVPNGDTAHLIVAKEGLDSPTSVAPYGDTLWISERIGGKVTSVPLPK